jgi:hypothetical protein
MQMHFPDGDAEINADGDGSGASEQSNEEQQPTEQFGECRHISQPRGKAHAADGMSEAAQPAEDFVIAMDGHDGAKRDAQHEQS